MAPETTPLQARLQRFDGLSCFACASARSNPLGLNLVFAETERGARTRFAMATRFESYRGYLHGGIVSAILDETMAYAGVLKLRRLPFTKTLTVDYRAAVAAGRELSCLSEIVRAEPERFWTQARIEDEKGRVLAQADGEFIIPTLRMAKRMMPGIALDELGDLFRQ